MKVGERYELGELLGSGGMGQVWRAFDRLLKKDVAIKSLSGNMRNKTALERFEREGLSASRLAHPNIASTFEVVIDGEQPYLVMELVDGVSLQEILAKKGSLKESVALKICSEIADGLAAIHDLGLVHRDIKPGNVIIERGTGTAKIVDFGLVHMPTDSQLTQQGVILGTPEYMAPESFTNPNNTAPSSDVFALGALLFEVLCGVTRIEGTPMAIAMGHIKENLVSAPIELVPHEFRELIDKMMAEDPNDRPQNGQEVFEVLEELRNSTLLPGDDEAFPIAVVRGIDLGEIISTIQQHGGRLGQQVATDQAIVFDHAEAAMSWALKTREDSPIVTIALSFGPVFGIESGLFVGTKVGHAFRTIQLCKEGEVLVDDAFHGEIGMGYRSHLTPLGYSRMRGHDSKHRVYRVRVADSQQNRMKLAANGDFVCPCGHHSTCLARSTVRIVCNGCGGTATLIPHESRTKTTSHDHDQLVLTKEHNILLVELSSV